MKDKTKKWLAVVILLAVCAGLLFGIHRMFYREPGREAEGVQATSEETEIYVETETTDVSETENQEAEPQESLVIEAEVATSVSDTEQEIQETPEKTEDAKPGVPPEVSEDTGIDQPDTPPVYMEEKAEQPTTAESQQPKTGDSKDGMVYVEGFGWIKDEGAGSGIYAGDMYENGNKIGIMD